MDYPETLRPIFLFPKSLSGFCFPPPPWTSFIEPLSFVFNTRPRPVFILLFLLFLLERHSAHSPEEFPEPITGISLSPLRYDQFICSFHFILAICFHCLLIYIYLLARAGRQDRRPKTKEGKVLGISIGHGEVFNYFLRLSLLLLLLPLLRHPPVRCNNFE